MYYFLLFFLLVSNCYSSQRDFTKKNTQKNPNISRKRLQEFIETNKLEATVSSDGRHAICSNCSPSARCNKNFNGFLEKHKCVKDKEIKNIPCKYCLQILPTLEARKKHLLLEHSKGRSKDKQAASALLLLKKQSTKKRIKPTQKASIPHSPHLPPRTRRTLVPYQPITYLPVQIVSYPTVSFLSPAFPVNNFQVMRNERNLLVMVPFFPY